MTNLARTLAFDMYGTLVDPLRIWQQLEAHIGADARSAAELWRAKQLEYTFRLTAMQRYEDFEQVTRKALDFALLVVGHDLSEAQRQSLVAGYDHLESYPDVESGLRSLQGSRQLAVLSNGTPRMLRAVVHAAGLARWFQTLISVDEVQTYKPSPRVYQHAAERLGRPIDEICLVSSNAFDVVGAMAVGLPCVWLNRTGGAFDTLGPRPQVVIASLSELAERL